MDTTQGAVQASKLDDEAARQAKRVKLKEFNDNPPLDQQGWCGRGCINNRSLNDWICRNSKIGFLAKAAHRFD